ncbi:MAG: sulfur oxidation c-type cytochrome SoxA [Burkholderiaceae bacterium]
MRTAKPLPPIGQPAAWMIVLVAALVLTALNLASPTAASAAGPAADRRRSGAEFMSDSTQAMQRDDALNPAFLWVKDGQALWQAVPGADAKSCAGCHGEGNRSMQGVAARYPAYNATLQRPVNLAAQINICREQHQHRKPWQAESAELLSLESYIALQSRTMPITPPNDTRLDAYRERGRQRFLQRMGQLDLSCAQCHTERAGLRLGSSTIPQGHPEGYPLYRLEWQGVGSLERRLRNCMSGVRAEGFSYGAVELVELELYLAARARGMSMEAPAVRP